MAILGSQWAHPVPMGFLLCAVISINVALPVLLLGVYGINGLRTTLKDGSMRKRLLWQLSVLAIMFCFLMMFSDQLWCPVSGIGSAVCVHQALHDSAHAGSPAVLLGRDQRRLCILVCCCDICASHSSLFF
jgi:hypothetical protein